MCTHTVAGGGGGGGFGKNGVIWCSRGGGGGVPKYVITNLKIQNFKEKEINKKT